MTKNLKNLFRKWNVFAIALIAMMSVGLSSCGGGDDDSNDIPSPVPQPINGVTITNNSSTSFRPLYIVYLNSSGEPLSQENLGDLLPNDSKTAKFPQGTAYYYLVTTQNGRTYYTANHGSSETSFIITASTTWMY